MFPRAVHGNGFLSVPVGTVDRPHNAKRQEGHPVTTTLENMDFFYATEIGIGTPHQVVRVLVDTGSSELWVNPDCRTAGSASQSQQCRSFGQYNPSDSTTPPVGPFGSETINYGDSSDESTQTSVRIRYYTDDIGLGNATITNQTFGVVSSSEDQSTGIMGLAPDVFSGFDGQTPYSLLLNTMADQGIIASRTFSLDLRHAEAETGAIIYGGADRNKFIGQLESRPIIRGQRGEFRLAVELTTLGLTVDGSDNYELTGNDTNVMLDSGTTLSRMHYSAVQPLLEALGAIGDGEGYFVVPCDLRDASGSVDFGFGSKTVRVPFSDFILDVGDPNYCYVGVAITTDQQILGDTVLRAGYFVFDWDNESVHIAQAANCGDNDVVAFGSGRNAVPDIEGNCQESDAAFTGGGPEPTRATQTYPTQAYTTTYTVTSCPEFERGCRTGVVTTQTIEAVTSRARETITVTAGGGGGDSAGAHMEVFGGMVAGFGALAAAMNAM
ncbi:aspartic peptidase domain-containing protein [Stachybotrys elegans]|uniref:Aspartic peptidase domain-containing protein n=1 Tax=Stachybotrys elegans TaxID=80388 RepID=A0A8K0WKQ5_9HYPO|nr:aspartic peptidase domain-containing protein [Stachybotrys elegans]